MSTRLKNNENNENKTLTKCTIFLGSSLFLLVTALILPFIPSLEVLKTPWYIIPISITTGLVAFNVLPFLTDYLHKKEIHIKDLIDKKYVNKRKPVPEQAVYYVKIYVFSLCTTSSIIFGVIIYYCFFDLQESKLSRIEIISVISTYILIFRKIQQWISSIILFCLMKCKNKCKNTIPETISGLKLSEMANIENINKIEETNNGIEMSVSVDIKDEVREVKTENVQ